MSTSSPSSQRGNGDLTPVRIERTTYSLGTRTTNPVPSEIQSWKVLNRAETSTTGPQQISGWIEDEKPNARSATPISMALARALIVDRQLFQRTKFADGCRVWTGAKQSRGYGNIMVDGRWLLVHRVFWVAERGPIPDELTIDHVCKTKLCILAAHLETVTLAENTRRAHPLHASCLRGHSFSGDNLYIAPNGRRTCRACRNASAARGRLLMSQYAEGGR